MRSFSTNVYPGDSGRRSLTPLPSDFIDARVLAANVAETHYVPTDARYVVFSSTDNFYVKFGTAGVTAVVPAAAITNGSGSELNPTARTIPTDATAISLIAPAGAVVVLSFYTA